MPSDAAELSSIATAVTEIESRVQAITRRYEGTKRDDLLQVLYEAERQLRATIRSIERASTLAP
jgi:hypothetical protein